MKILVISQYFYPENFRINDLCFSLSKNGHEITVLTGKPNYPNGDYFEEYSWNSSDKEIIENIPVFRANLFLRKKGKPLDLILNYLSFVFFGSIKVLKIKSNFDKIFIYAPSPITVGIVGLIAKIKFKAKTYLWVHDLWPESVKVAGGVKSKLIISLTDIMTRFIYTHSDFILVQSPAFKDYILKQNIPENKIIYYPYYAEEFYKPRPKEKRYKKYFPKGFNIVFAGNIGHAQNLETLVKSSVILKKKGIKVNFIIFGDGRDKKRIKDLINKENLNDFFYFQGSLPAAEMPYIFSFSDSLFLSLKKSIIFSKTIPGKFQSYIACGKPIIASIDGITSEIIVDNEIGFVSPAEDSLQLSNVIIKMKTISSLKREKFEKNALNYFKNNFNKQDLINKLEFILKSN